MNFLNLQGIPFVFGGSTILGIRHLWFMTAIMFAYFSTPIMQYFKKYADILFPVTLVFVAVGYLFLPMKWMFLASWVYLYAIGYLYVNLSHKRIYEYTLFVLIVLLLIFTKWGNLIVYFDKLGRLFHDVAGIFVVIWGVKLLSLINKLRVLGLIKLFDEYSYNVFLVHYILIVGPFSLANVTSNIGANIVIMLFAAVIATMLFIWINGLLDKWFFDRWFKELQKV